MSLEANIENFFKAEIQKTLGNDAAVFTHQSDDSIDVSGSYVSIRVESMEEVIINKGVYAVDFQIWVLTHIDDATSDEHQEFYQGVDNAIFNAANKPGEHSGCKFFGMAPRIREQEEMDEMFGNVFYLKGGFGYGAS